MDTRRFLLLAILVTVCRYFRIELGDMSDKQQRDVFLVVWLWIPLIIKYINANSFGLLLPLVLISGSIVLSLKHIGYYLRAVGEVQIRFFKVLVQIFKRYD